MNAARDAAAAGGRSHPPALSRRTERTLREETSLTSGDRILVAISGGGDSVALLDVLARLAPRLRIELHAHGVDHGRRPEASAELDLAGELAARLGVAFTRSLLAVPEGGNLQARAREARYAALDAVAHQIGARWVATAHHASDRAETLLLRLLRGSSPRGLGVLPAESARRLRPFIRSPKSAIEQHLERHALRHASDPSNTDPRFLRTRIRNELLPLLEQLTPGAARRLNLLADECAETFAPLVTDAQGRELNLGRNQAAQIRRAQKLGQPDARIWLAGGRELRVARDGLVEWAEDETGSAATAHSKSAEKSSARGHKKPRPARQKPTGRGCQTHQK